MRRAFDVALVLLLAPPCAVVAFVVAVVVAANLGRPVLFRQQRSGLHGSTFELVKFRSMQQAFDQAGQPLPDHLRVTRFGRLLRRSRLDELPELWNILKGEMAFVGPRPLLPETVLGMARPGRRRGTVRPGLTGWAQINGNALLRDEDKLALDLWYVEHASLRLDLLILLATARVVLFGERISERRVREAYASGIDRDR